MGGGDLNMKKSWHPLLLKNQERVWLEEKKALEEKKKLDQLRKEKEEERQLQELQRMQEEQTGKKRQEKLDWMYATPATGSSANANDLEDYLLGKKRVDKILIGSEHEKLGAAHKNFIATQYANTARDTASKIREDPLLAIKQQEQAAYQALMSNPLRLKEMQERNGVKVKKDKKDKKGKEKKEKKHRKDKHRERSVSPRSERDRYSRSPSPLSRYRQRSPSYERNDGRDRYDRYDTDRRRGRSRSRSPDRRRGNDRRDFDDRSGRYDAPPRRWSRSDESDEPERRGDERRRRFSPDDRQRRRSPSGSPDRRREAPPPPSRARDVSPPPPRAREASPPPSRRPTSYANNASRSNSNSTTSKPPASADSDRAARLAAMSADANTMSADRRERLTQLLEQEKAELAAEERVRARAGGVGSFLNAASKQVFSGEGGLEERIRRGRGQMYVGAD